MRVPSGNRIAITNAAPSFFPYAHRDSDSHIPCSTGDLFGRVHRIYGNQCGCGTSNFLATSSAPPHDSDHAAWSILPLRPPLRRFMGPCGGRRRGFFGHIQTTTDTQHGRRCGHFYPNVFMLLPMTTIRSAHSGTFRDTPIHPAVITSDPACPHMSPREPITRTTTTCDLGTRGPFFEHAQASPVSHTSGSVLNLFPRSEQIRQPL